MAKMSIENTWFEYATISKIAPVIISGFACFYQVSDRRILTGREQKQVHNGKLVLNERERNEDHRKKNQWNKW
jgi:hypothetical protein